jgi:hypothetical protein
VVSINVYKHTVQHLIYCVSSTHCAFHAIVGIYSVYFPKQYKSSGLCGRDWDFYCEAELIVNIVYGSVSMELNRLDLNEITGS